MAAEALYTWSPAELRAYEVLKVHALIDAGRETARCQCGASIQSGRYPYAYAEHLMAQLSEAGLLLVEIPQRFIDMGAGQPT